MSTGTWRVREAKAREVPPHALPETSQTCERAVDFLAEAFFRRVLALERKRSERSDRPFLLMLLDAQQISAEKREKTFLNLAHALSFSTRETDNIGWYETHLVLGVIFTEIGLEASTSLPALMRTRVSAALPNNGSGLNAIRFSFHFFPEGWRKTEGLDPKLYAASAPKKAVQEFRRLMKRTVDVAGSVLALCLFSPLFLAISLAIKLSSRGPSLFRQERVGRYGVRFQCLKFRTMHVGNDPTIHKHYVERFIAGKIGSGDNQRDSTGVYKLTADPRVTRIGNFLRKTSLDELPQFWNVLKGEMSLVGPRPAIPYEFKTYDLWHRRRVVEVKPGITGLWQVSGRSKTSFDDMVRLDLRYAKTWSLWLDLKILLRTPRAVFTGEGAY